MSYKENNTNKTQSKRSAKTPKIKFSLTRLVVFLIIIAISTVVGFVFKPQIESLLNKKDNSVTDTTVIDNNGLSVHFIDIGQGDSIAIRFPDQKTMLVDAGPKSSESVLIDYLQNNFFEQGENHFDYLLLTHSDEDHCGGMPKVCETFVIDKIYRPYMYCVKYDIDETNGNSTNKNTKSTDIYYKTIKAFKGEIDSNGHTAEMVFTDLSTVNSSQKIQGENYSIDFYAPTLNYLKSSDTIGTIENDFSPIMVLNYNSKKIMLTGDATISSEEKAMNMFELPDVDLLKVGHHGSKTSTGANFLATIKPEIAVISVGEGNSYKHPTQETLDRLTSAGSMIYRTDLNGTVVANVTSESVAELNIIVGVKTASNGVYIHIEYILLCVVVVSLALCFGIRIKI